MANNAGHIRIQICYAKPERQFLREATVAQGTDIAQALRISGVLSELDDVDPATCKVGIHGKIKTMDTPLREGDRIEIYRPLQADPKDARRRRVQEKK